MKRSLFFIPMILLILLNACGGNSDVPPTTQIPTVVTGTPPLGPEASFIFDYLNRSIEKIELRDKFDEVEHITGANYQIVNVDFPPQKDGSTVFHVETRCECTRNAQCCSPTRPFVVTLKAIDNLDYREAILGQVNTVRNFNSTTRKWRQH